MVRWRGVSHGNAASLSRPLTLIHSHPLALALSLTLSSVLRVRALDLPAITTSQQPPASKKPPAASADMVTYAESGGGGTDETLHELDGVSPGLRPSGHASKRKGKREGKEEKRLPVPVMRSSVEASYHAPHVPFKMTAHGGRLGA